MIRKTASTLPDARPLLWLGMLVLIAGALSAFPVRSQELDPVELEELVAPIALYPDDVLGIILPAATFPLDIVRAARFLDDLEADPTLQPDEAWDDSIVALLNYPEVVRMMNEDLDWTWALGEAVLTDQAAVLDAAQQFRSRAYAAGNLRSDDKQVVGYSDGAIQIRPADPEVVYIPVYEPRQVVIYNAVPRYRYYPVAYPVYYYPYPVGYSFGIDYFWGVTSYFSIGWHSHYVHVLHHSHRTHPYYLNSYYLYAPYYPRSSVNITVAVNNYTNVWTPSPRRGSRPRTVTVESRTSSVRPRTVTTETQPNVSTRTRSTSLSPGASSSRATAGSNRARSATSGRPAAAPGGVAQSPGGRSQADTTRAQASRAATQSAANGTGARSSRGQAAGGAPRVSPQPSSNQSPSPSTRGSAISQPATRPQVTAPAAPRPSQSMASSAQSATRRAAPAAAPRAAAPAPRAAAPAPRAAAPSPNSAAIGGTRQAPSRGDTGGRTRR